VRYGFIIAAKSVLVIVSVAPVPFEFAPPADDEEELALAGEKDAAANVPK
jgi:hypothetical protein